MQVGVIGLGKMGSGLAARLVTAGHIVVGHDPYAGKVDIPGEFSRAESYDELLSYYEDRCKLKESYHALCQEVPILMLSVPAGDSVDKVIDDALEHADAIDVIIDTGNSYYKRSVERYERCKDKGVAFIDCGVSGGLAGQERGYCCMIGGDEPIYKKYEPLFQAIAMEDGYAYMGPAGSGHFVKMVHNGIEYGLLEAYAEGFHVLKSGPYDNLDLKKISHLWQHGAIISSFLLTLIEEVYKDPSVFDGIVGKVEEGGTGRWTYEEAQERDIPVPVLEAALKQRKKSRETGGNYATKLIALLRKAFGGHSVHKKN